MPEWLEWHRALGVDRVYVFDSSAEPLNATLGPYIDSGLVEYYHMAPDIVRQHPLLPQLQVRKVVHNCRERDPTLPLRMAVVEQDLEHSRACCRCQLWSWILAVQFSAQD